MRPGKRFPRSLGRIRGTGPEAGDTTTAALADAEALVQAGRVPDAIDRLVAANRTHRDPAIEIRTLRLHDDAVIQVLRLAIVTDAFLGQICYRAKARCRDRDGSPSCRAGSSTTSR